MSDGATVRIDLSNMERKFSEREHRKRQAEFSERAAFLMRKYVPQEEGTLRSSEPLNSNYAAGLVIWSTPYARKQYTVPMHHTTAGTTDHWCQAMKNRDMGKLVEYARHLYDD